MIFPLSPRAEDLKRRVTAFMEAHVYPAESVYERQLNEAPTRWVLPPVMEELKDKAKAEKPAAKSAAKPKAAAKKTAARKKASKEDAS